MSDKLTYEVLAEAFIAEGVEKHFSLSGDANMYFCHALAHRNVEMIHARHEHCAVAMADGYYRATGKVGTASTTCGPGFTQIATALTMAARGNIPLVVFAGDSPTNASFHVQYLDPGPLTATTGAHYINIRNMDRLLDNVREAFYVAQHDHKPVVLNVPVDFQRKPFPHLVKYRPSSTLLPAPQRLHPDPRMIDLAVEEILAAKNPIVLAGRGAAWSGATQDVIELGDRIGALFATSLLGKDQFDGVPFSIGTAGAFATTRARELWAEADLVIGVGAGLGHYTTEGGYLYPNARVIAIDTNPRGLYQGLRVADLHIKSDAKAAVQAILQKLKERNHTHQGVRTNALAGELATIMKTPDPQKFPPRPNVVDPREAIRALDELIPKDWEIVTGSAHFFSIALTHLSGRDCRRYHVINDFGAIGSGLADAIGIAAGKGDGKVLLIEGDGSMMMHIQELETIARQGIKLLMCVMNDGGYASEAHKFKAQGMDNSEAMHGRGNLEGVARAFGLRAATVQSLAGLKTLFDGYQANKTGELWDFHVDEEIPSALFRRVHFGQIV
jgi:acetolactate synthase-1/2/3 large subunit